MSPRTKKQFEEIREEKRTLIMDVALEHFARTGYHATTISHIARHAGISKGLMYNYFKSKEELLAEIISRSAAEVYDSFDPNNDGYLTEDEFEIFIRQLFRQLYEQRQFWRLIYGIMLQRGVYDGIFGTTADRPGAEGLSLKHLSEGMMAQLTDYFNRKKGLKGPDYDPTAELLMFTSALKGFALTLIFSNELYPEGHYEKTIEALIKTYR